MTGARQSILKSIPIRVPRRSAFGLAGTYFAISALWIRFSNVWVNQFSGDSIERLKQLHQYKGFGFIVVTSTALYFGVRWVSKKAATSAVALHESQERWIEAERQAAPALLASLIAHDVANLVQVIRLNIERLKRLSDLPTVATEAVYKLDRGTDRLMALVKRLRGASTSLFHDPPARFDFSKCVEETLSLMRGHSALEGTDVEFQGAENGSLLGYPVLVHQLVMNLLINAAEATGAAGRVRFTVGLQGQSVSLKVDDDGPGIAPSLRTKVLGAFFTTKATGSGLGLSSVRSCVDIHQGTLEIADSELGGACFTITLPDLTYGRIEQLRSPDRRPRPNLESSLPN